MSPKAVTFQEKILPSQPAYRDRFAGEEERFYPALYETLVRFGGLKPPTEEFTLQRSERVAIEEQAWNPIALRFLELLIA